MSSVRLPQERFEATLAHLAAQGSCDFYEGDLDAASRPTCKRAAGRCYAKGNVTGYGQSVTGVRFSPRPKERGCERGLAVSTDAGEASARGQGGQGVSLMSPAASVSGRRLRRASGECEPTR
jgi:hypothetical protein